MSQISTPQNLKQIALTLRHNHQIIVHYITENSNYLSTYLFNYFKSGNGQAKTINNSKNYTTFQNFKLIAFNFEAQPSNYTQYNHQITPRNHITHKIKLNTNGNINSKTS